MLAMLATRMLTSIVAGAPELLPYYTTVALYPWLYPEVQRLFRLVLILCLWDAQKKIYLNLYSRHVNRPTKTDMS
jgi:hypothetical protein